MPAEQLQTQSGQTKWFFFEEGDGLSAATAYKQSGTSAIANLVTRSGTNGQAAAADGTQAQQLRAIAEATTLATPNTGVLTDFIIGSGASVSNFVLLNGRAFLLRTPTGLEGALLYFRVRFTTGSGTGERLMDSEGNPLSVTITTTQSIYALPFLTDAIGSEIALETVANSTTVTTQAASRTLQIKSLR